MVKVTLEDFFSLSDSMKKWVKFKLWQLKIPAPFDLLKNRYLQCRTPDNDFDRNHKGTID